MQLTIPIYAWVAGLGVTGAAFLAVLFYFRKDRPAKLVYQWNGRVLVGKEKEKLPDDIKVAMKEAGSPYISTSEIIFWNAGQQTIRGSEVDPAEPLRIWTPWGSKILRIVTRSSTNDGISFDAMRDPEQPNGAFFNFESLGPGDGVRLQLFETGVNYAINIAGGAVHGAPGGILNWGRAPIGDASSAPASRMARYWWYTPIAYLVLVIVGIPTVLLIKKPAMDTIQIFNSLRWVIGCGCSISLSWVGLLRFKR